MCKFCDIYFKICLINGRFQILNYDVNWSIISDIFLPFSPKIRIKTKPAHHNNNNNSKQQQQVLATAKVAVEVHIVGCHHHKTPYGLEKSENRTPNTKLSN